MVPEFNLEEWCDIQAREAFYFSENAIVSRAMWDVNGERVTRERAEAHIIYIAKNLEAVKSGVCDD
jgi:hypothetical protein